MPVFQVIYHIFVIVLLCIWSLKYTHFFVLHVSCKFQVFFFLPSENFETSVTSAVVTFLVSLRFPMCCCGAMVFVVLLLSCSPPNNVYKIAYLKKIYVFITYSIYVLAGPKCIKKKKNI